MSPDAETLRDQHLAMLSRLAEIGMKVAQAIEMHADAVIVGGVDVEANETARQAFALYPKIARSIRLTLMLQDKLLISRVEKKQEAASARAGQIERIVRRVAEREGREALEIEHLAYEAAERLESEDLYGDITARPASELIARVCKDLDLTPDWSTLAEEAWARDEIETGPIGWPLADLMAPAPETLPPRWGKGRVGGVGSELPDSALMGSGAPPPDC